MVNDDYATKNTCDNKTVSPLNSYPIKPTSETVQSTADWFRDMAAKNEAVSSAPAMAHTAPKNKAVDEINPDSEVLFWKENYKTRPYVVTDSAFDKYQAAYKYGIDMYQRYPDRDFDLIEPSLSAYWYDSHGTSGLKWNIAKHASRDAFEKLRSYYL